MNVLLLNGSPHAQGNTYLALDEIAKTLRGNGIGAEIVQLGIKPVRGCIACGQCHARGLGRCAFDDDTCNRILEKLHDADGFVVGSPVYYGQPNGALLAVLQRICYAGSAIVKGKPAAAVAVCRRGGATAAFQTLQMPFQMLHMPLATSQYWNIVYGRAPGDAAFDAEGMQTMRALARNMARLLRGQAAVPPQPLDEPWAGTHFVRDDLR
ncbi:MAG: flavodoxin family protein [Kiritimatiellae bacterium]|nr:flavodoxin family protein [Kiritimatiellia bacterium]